MLVNLLVVDDEEDTLVYGFGAGGRSEIKAEKKISFASKNKIKTNFN